LENVLGVFIELVLADTHGKIWGEVMVDNLGDCEGKGGLGVEELELLRSERRAKSVGARDGGCMSSPSMGVWGGDGQVSLYSWLRSSSHLEERTNRSQLLMGFSSSGMRVVESETGLLAAVVLSLVVEMGLGLVGSSKVILILLVSTLISTSICTGDMAVKGTGERIGLSLFSTLWSSTLAKRRVLMSGSSMQLGRLYWGHCRGGVEAFEARE